MCWGSNQMSWPVSFHNWIYTVWMPAPFAYNWTHSVYILHPFASFLGIKSGPLAVVRPTITNPPISTKLTCPPIFRVKTCSHQAPPTHTRGQVLPRGKTCPEWIVMTVLSLNWRTMIIRGVALPDGLGLFVQLVQLGSSGTYYWLYLAWW